MLKFQLTTPEDLKVAARIEHKRQIDEARKSRIFDPRLRGIGVSLKIILLIFSLRILNKFFLTIMTKKKKNNTKLETKKKRVHRIDFRKINKLIKIQLEEFIKIKLRLIVVSLRRR